MVSKSTCCSAKNSQRAWLGSDQIEKWKGSVPPLNRNAAVKSCAVHPDSTRNWRRSSDRNGCGEYAGGGGEHHFLTAISRKSIGPPQQSQTPGFQSLDDADVAPVVDIVKHAILEAMDVDDLDQVAAGNEPTCEAHGAIEELFVLEEHAARWILDERMDALVGDQDHRVGGGVGIKLAPLFQATAQRHNLAIECSELRLPRADFGQVPKASESATGDGQQQRETAASHRQNLLTINAATSPSYQSYSLRAMRG